MLDYLYLLLISIISNIFSAFSGGGAGVIQLPAILLLFDINFIKALATHKVATVALGIGATIKFMSVVKFNKALMLKLLSFGLPGTIIGAFIIVDTNEILSKFLLGLLIIFIGLYSFKEKKYGEYQKVFTNNLKNNLIGFCIIFLIGLLNGSLSAGTGLIFTVILISWYGMDYKTAIAYTLIVVGLFYNLIGAITLSLHTDLDLKILPTLFIGSLIGGYIGAKISLTKSNKFIKRTYQAITILVGLTLII